MLSNFNIPFCHFYYACDTFNSCLVFFLPPIVLYLLRTVNVDTFDVLVASTMKSYFVNNNGCLLHASNCAKCYTVCDLVECSKATQWGGFSIWQKRLLSSEKELTYHTPAVVSGGASTSAQKCLTENMHFDSFRTSVCQGQSNLHLGPTSALEIVAIPCFMFWETESGNFIIHYIVTGNQPLPLREK